MHKIIWMLYITILYSCEWLLYKIRRNRQSEFKGKHVWTNCIFNLGCIMNTGNPFPLADTWSANTAIYLSMVHTNSIVQSVKWCGKWESWKLQLGKFDFVMMYYSKQKLSMANIVQLIYSNLGGYQSPSLILFFPDAATHILSTLEPLTMASTQYIIMLKIITASCDSFTDKL